MRRGFQKAPVFDLWIFPCGLLKNFAHAFDKTNVMDILGHQESRSFPSPNMANPEFAIAIKISRRGLVPSQEKE